MDKSAAHTYLRALVYPGDTVYTILRHVARSGMSRRISLFVVRDGAPLDITFEAGKVLGERVTDRELTVTGCGMDMGFNTVYNLGRVLFPQFVCTGEDCRSNDHSNGDRDYTPHLHSDPGYALHQRWF